MANCVLRTAQGESKKEDKGEGRESLRERMLRSLAQELEWGGGQKEMLTGAPLEERKYSRPRLFLCRFMEVVLSHRRSLGPPSLRFEQSTFQRVK